MLHLLPHWNWLGKEGQDIDVRCFSNCEEVELFLNGQSLGKRAMPKNSHLTWKVPYTPGTLLAKGYKDGQVVAQERVETTGAPATIRLTPDRPTINADGQDVSIVTVAVADAQGRIVPVADNLIQFELNGPGKILGVGNGDPSSHEPDVYITPPSVRVVELDRWRMKRVSSTANAPEAAEVYDENDWRQARVRSDNGALQPGQSAVFRAHFTPAADDLAATHVILNFGMIDDDGWVYVNGRPAGEAHDWASAHSFDIRPLLHAGENTIAVAVKNGEGRGGLAKGVSVQIEEKPVPVQWKRSVFNGLAQIIMQGSTTAGELRLTASSPSLQRAVLTVPAQACKPTPAVPAME